MHIHAHAYERTGTCTCACAPVRARAETQADAHAHMCTRAHAHAHLQVAVIGFEENMDNPMRPDISKTHTAYIIRTSAAPRTYDAGSAVEFKAADGGWVPARIVEVGARAHARCLPVYPPASSRSKTSMVSVRPNACARTRACEYVCVCARAGA